MRTILIELRTIVKPSSAILGSRRAGGEQVPRARARTPTAFRVDLERARRALAERPGHVETRSAATSTTRRCGSWSRTWEHVGAYRRALSAYDVKLHAVPVLEPRPRRAQRLRAGRAGSRPQRRRHPVVRLSPSTAYQTGSQPADLKVSCPVAKPPASTLDHVVSLCKRRGFVYPCGEIYGGTRSAWDYGPLGVELKENIKRQWWKAMVTAARGRGRPRLQRHPADPDVGGQRPPRARSATR